MMGKKMIKDSIKEMEDDPDYVMESWAKKTGIQKRMREY